MLIGPDHCDQPATVFASFSDLYLAFFNIFSMAPPNSRFLSIVPISLTTKEHITVNINGGIGQIF